MRGITVIAAAVLMTGCAQGEFAKHYPVSAPAANPLTIGDKKIPLPAGEWVIAARETSTSSLGTPMGALVLVNRRATDPALAVAVRTSLGGTFGTRWEPLAACDRKDVLWSSAAGETCMFVNHVVLTRSQRTSALYAAALDYAQGNGLAVPNTALTVTYHLSDMAEFLTVRYYFNPETAGFAPDTGGGWRTSDWHRDRIVRDPRRVEHIESLKRWSATWLEKVKAGFNGALRP